MHYRYYSTLIMNRRPARAVGGTYNQKRDFGSFQHVAFSGFAHVLSAALKIKCCRSVKADAVAEPASPAAAKNCANGQHYIIYTSHVLSTSSPAVAIV
jgi:hypothetical protein